MTPQDGVGLPAAFRAPGSASFVDFLAAAAPDLLPGRALAEETSGAVVDAVPHATTVLALVFPGGVIMAGDRRATLGTHIAHREMRKVFPADDFAAIGVAGTAGLALELVRLYRLELEHYEKIEGAILSLEGKANRLATIVRAQLPMAMRGLAVVPLLAGFDVTTGAGRIFSYDVTGGRYEERDHHAVGSGAVFARGSLKKRWRPGLTEAEAVEVAVEALLDAADDDAATAGPDVARGIWPVVAAVTAQGYRAAADDELGAVVGRVLARRAAGEGAR